jgi:hypothetical protein
MAHVVQPLDQPSNYKDSQARIDRQKQNELLAKSTTLYVRHAFASVVHETELTACIWSDW